MSLSATISTQSLAFDKSSLRFLQTNSKTSARYILDGTLMVETTASNPGMGILILKSTSGAFDVRLEGRVGVPKIEALSIRSLTLYPERVAEDADGTKLEVEGGAVLPFEAPRGGPMIIREGRRTIEAWIAALAEAGIGSQIKQNVHRKGDWITLRNSGLYHPKVF